MERIASLFKPLKSEFLEVALSFKLFLTIVASAPIVTRTFFFIIYEEKDDFASHPHSDVKRKLGNRVVA